MEKLFFSKKVAVEILKNRSKKLLSYAEILWKIINMKIFKRNFTNFWNNFRIN